MWRALTILCCIIHTRTSDNAFIEATDITVIDMSQYDQNFTVLSQDALNGLETYGFLSIINIDELDTNKLLSISKSFFESRIAYKLQYAKCKWNATNDNCYRGYYPIIPGQSSMKEAIEYGRSRESVQTGEFPSFSLYEFPQYPNLEDWKSVFDDHYEVLLRTATKLMRLISYGLYGNTTEKPINYFEPMFLPYTLSTLRLMHSPSHPLFEQMENDGDREEFCVTSTPDHMDSGFITLVIPFNKGMSLPLHYQCPAFMCIQLCTGLEAYNEAKNQWEKLPLTNEDEMYGNNLIHVNVGRTLRNMTDQRLKATRHRVINYGEDRYSLAFFFEPNYDTPIPVGINGELQNYGDWIVEIDKQFVEYSDLPVGMCWVGEEREGLQCVDPNNETIAYDHDDGLYEKFVDGNT